MSSNIIALPSITRDMLPVWTICIILLNDMSNAFCQPQNLLSTIKVNWSLTNWLSWYASGLHFLVVAICYDTLCKNQKVWINPLDICHTWWKYCHFWGFYLHLQELSFHKTGGSNINIIRETWGSKNTSFFTPNSLQSKLMHGCMFIPNINHISCHLVG